MTITREAIPVSATGVQGPVLPFAGLDVLWLQITGTVCNIACTHCFISCGPKNDSHGIMATTEILELLADGRQQGVKEYYFTGGEPFLHPEIERLIEATLKQGPLGILTNGLLIDAERARRLAKLEATSDYSLDLRVSIDGVTAAENDPIRGNGTFEKILAGARHLDQAGLHPVFTVTTVHANYDSADGRGQFLDALSRLGFSRPRVKFIPPFHIGREVARGGAYGESHVLGAFDLFEGEEQVLQCGSCRTVTDKGVYPCPILIEEEGARMGNSLREALRPIELNHPACKTCHEEGFSCRT